MSILRKQATTYLYCKRLLTSSSSAISSPLHFIDGRRYDVPESKHVIQIYSPSTGKEITTLAEAGKVEVHKAVNIAKIVQPFWAELTGLDRAAVLHRAAYIIRAHEEELTRAEVIDVGKPIWEARADVLGCADVMDYFAGLAPGLEGDHLPLSNGNFGYNRREPLGVCVGIGAWNYPFQMSVWKSAPALAAGNAFVFKPSPLTPVTAVMLGEVYAEAGLLNGCYNVVQGGVSTGELLCAHDDVAKVSFTGSVAGGSKVMQNCAKGIKPVTLELGGKSAMIVFDDADLDNAVKGAMMANFLNQGQVCSNASRVFVHRSIAKEFTERLIKRTSAMKIGDPMDEATTVGATITEQHAHSVLGYIHRAKQQGSRVLYGGDRVALDDPSLAGGWYLRPCILGNVTDDMEVALDEVFGSVLCIMTFDNEDEVIRRANNTSLGLAGAVFTTNLHRAHRVIAKLQAGSLCINNYNLYPPGLPFGGYKRSGIGRENCKDTLHAYTQLKSVYVELGDVDCPL